MQVEQLKILLRKMLLPELAPLVLAYLSTALMTRQRTGAIPVEHAMSGMQAEGDLVICRAYSNSRVEDFLVYSVVTGARVADVRLHDVASNVALCAGRLWFMTKRHCLTAVDQEGRSVFAREMRPLSSPSAQYTPAVSSTKSAFVYTGGDKVVHFYNPYNQSQGQIQVVPPEGDPSVFADPELALDDGKMFLLGRTHLTFLVFDFKSPLRYFSADMLRLKGLGPSWGLHDWCITGGLLVVRPAMDGKVCFHEIETGAQLWEWGLDLGEEGGGVEICRDREGVWIHTDDQFIRYQ